MEAASSQDLFARSIELVLKEKATTNYRAPGRMMIYVAGYIGAETREDGKRSNQRKRDLREH
jgi:hypothetical protein